MTTIKSRKAKGKQLEDFVADKLRSSGVDINAVRQIGSGSGKRKGDINTGIGWTIECKNSKRFDWSGATKQVRREGMGYQKEVIVYHSDRTPLDDSVAIINLDDFVDLLKAEKNNQNSRHDEQPYQA